MSVPTDPRQEAWQPDDRAVLCFVFDASPDDPSGRVLLIEKLRGLGAGKINAPGGKQEPGESLAETAIRETREEVGLTVSQVSHRGVLRFTFADGYRLEVHIFFAGAFLGQERPSPEANPFWCSLSKIPYQRMWQDDELWLPRVLRGLSVEAEIAFDRDTMTEWELRFSDGTVLRTDDPAAAHR